MSFADVEARANASVFKALANALAVFTPDVGEPVEFPVVFDAAGQALDEIGVVTVQPQLQMQPAAFSALEEGMTLAIRADVPDSVGAPYIVRTVAPLDEGGRQRVFLARA